MKRLLYITPRLDGAGGVQHVFSIKTNYLQKKYGYAISIVTTNSRSENILFDFSQIEHINKKINGFGPFYLWNYIQLVKQQIKIKNPDILIIVDNGLKGFLLPFFLRNSKVKIVFEQRGFRFYEAAEQTLNVFQRLKYSVLNAVINYTMSFVDQMVVLTKASEKEWKLKKIKTIPNPLWIDNPKENSLDHKNAIFVGRQEYVKGYDLLVPIWKQVVTKYPDWKLHIYSAYNPELRLKELVKKLMLEDFIVFHEPTNTIQEAYANASIYLMTSRHEGFGNVLLEAMACGLPCVAYNCPTGPAELIQDDSCGFLITPFDEVLYVEKVIALIENETLRKEMGRNAQKSVQKYKLASVMEQWHQLFSSL